MAASVPVIYAGQGVTGPRPTPSSRNWPSCSPSRLHQPAGQSCFDETHPLALGSGGRAYPKAVRTFLDKSDVILGIGCCPFTETNFGISMPAGRPLSRPRSTRRTSTRT